MSAPTLAVQLSAPSPEALAWLSSCRIKLFADGASLEAIAGLARHDFIKGFTTNPTLMRQAGVADYERFAREVLSTVRDLSTQQARVFTVEVVNDRAVFLRDATSRYSEGVPLGDDLKAAR